jgi:hypothetical protein
MASDNQRLKSGTSFKIPDEAPIKHTAGGEMPDPNKAHHVDSKELESLGDFEEETFSLLDQIKGYLPLALSVVGIGLGGFLLYRLYDRSRSREEGDLIGDEGKSAQKIDEVPPSRLMGA